MRRNLLGDGNGDGLGRDSDGLGGEARAPGRNKDAIYDLLRGHHGARLGHHEVGERGVSVAGPGEVPRAMVDPVSVLLSVLLELRKSICGPLVAVEGVGVDLALDICSVARGSSAIKGKRDALAHGRLICPANGVKIDPDLTVRLRGAGGEFNSRNVRRNEGNDVRCVHQNPAGRVIRDHGGVHSGELTDGIILSGEEGDRLVVPPASGGHSRGCILDRRVNGRRAARDRGRANGRRRRRRERGASKHRGLHRMRVKLELDRDKLAELDCFERCVVENNRDGKRDRSALVLNDKNVRALYERQGRAVGAIIADSATAELTVKVDVAVPLNAGLRDNLAVGDFCYTDVMGAISKRLLPMVLYANRRGCRALGNRSNVELKRQRTAFKVTLYVGESRVSLLGRQA